ncbi:MAG: hypothetical protein DYG98_17370 [Haliscomenobacteraceae bacterium CHB4]|nr:hypothetical protein [Saprospiraceae bacterium]MCE7924823.1 hypothetical protein [Haliscomenobacteraceae bacterium CHB4]
MGQKCGRGRGVRRIKAAKRSGARVKRRKGRGEMPGGGAVAATGRGILSVLIGCVHFGSKTPYVPEEAGRLWYVEGEVHGGRVRVVPFRALQR